MKKTLIALVILILLGAGAYYLANIDKEETAQNAESQYATFSKSELGLEFKYKTGKDGYVIDERIPADIGELVRVLIVKRVEDAEKTPPVGGEWPPAINISVFQNTKKQFAGVWAEENVQYSNINLKTSDVKEVVVGGANAVQYTADGLYASDNVVVAHGDNIYVINGQFMDAGDDIRSDFQSIVDSIKFIPTPSQE